MEKEHSIQKDFVFDTPALTKFAKVMFAISMSVLSTRGRRGRAWLLARGARNAWLPWGEGLIKCSWFITLIQGKKKYSIDSGFIRGGMLGFIWGGMHGDFPRGAPAWFYCRTEAVGFSSGCVSTCFASGGHALILSWEACMV